MRKRSGIKIMCRLAGLVKPMFPLMAAAVIMGVAGFLCAILITVFGGYALLGALGQTIPISMLALFVSVGVFALLRGVLRYAEQACNHYIAFKLLARIRDKVFTALRKLAPAKLEGRDKGNLISVITSDIEQLEVFYAHTISPAFIALITSLLLVFFIGSFHWLLAAVSLAGYLVVGLVLPAVTSRMGKKAGMQYRESLGGLNTYLLDSLRGLRESIQFGRGEKRLEQLDVQSDSLDLEQQTLKRVEGASKAATDAAILLFSAAMLFVSLYLFQQGIVGFDGVLIPTIALVSSFGPVVALSNLANNLVQTLASGDRVLDILDERPVVQEVTDGKDVGFQGANCENVTFAYGQEPVLSDLSMDVPKNEMIGISGKSGSGKSTLLKLFMRFWDTDSGQVSLSSQNIKTVNTRSLRDAQGFVTQETQLFHCSIEDNIKIANREATHEQVVAAAKKASLHSFISALPQGYRTNVGELGGTLSGGERQRIGIARAFLHDAPLLLLDEPTSNLDSLNEGIILKSLKEECSQKTVLLVSHRKSTMKIADRVYSVESGRLS